MRTKEQIKKAIEEKNFSWLGRENFIEDFSKFLLNENNSMHICLDGTWGSGKTTTLFGIMKRIQEIAESTEEYDEPLILYLDAWEYEHYDHPAFALLKVMEKENPEIIEQMRAMANKDNSLTELSITISFISATFGFNHHPNLEILQQAELIDSLNSLMIKAIQKYKEEKNNKLIIIIDELDRAKPDFVMKVLEMFHHLRDELPTHVVYSVDRDQLNSIIKHYYGYEYNTSIFVHKVFDLTFKLEKISDNTVHNYILNFLNIRGIQTNPRSVTEYLKKYLGIIEPQSLRTIKMLGSVKNFSQIQNSHLVESLFILLENSQARYPSPRDVSYSCSD